MTFACIGLGGNSIGGRRHLARAVKLIAKLPGVRLAAVSPVYISAPLGCPGRQREYLNGAIKIQTALSPRRIFLMLNGVEKKIQRHRRRRNAPRRLDADYLLHGCAVLRGALVLPHPRMLRRAFVLAPLADIFGKNYTGLRRADALRAARADSANQELRRLP
ncbi:MAG: 2-amino-4-hydroxy-6-hydroxymethyldihydropteridine diphosphokinase [Betaproteobacteria bacterium]|nr:2-amino-4-hydroxy-6-hydroxymethyldihydropteridine diphosphokinase [Betaproteobacteria bacterium]